MLVTHLLCSCIVLRAVLSKRWMDENERITSTAFLYDPEKHPDGLSVNIAFDTDLDQWLGNFNKSFGADSLHSGRVRRLGLEIGQTEADLMKDRSHAVIVGLPPVDEDPQLAEDIATELVKMSRTIDRTIRKK